MRLPIPEKTRVTRVAPGRSGGASYRGDMFICPRCGAYASAIRQELEVALPGGAWGPELVTSGWMCDNDHFLAPQEAIRT